MKRVPFVMFTSCDHPGRWSPPRMSLNQEMPRLVIPACMRATFTLYTHREAGRERETLPSFG
jgi:hypothetical protein